MPPGGKRARRWLPLAAAAALAVPPVPAAATPFPGPPVAAELGPLDIPQATAEFWAAYLGAGDVRRALAKLDHRLRAEGGNDAARHAARMLLAHREGRSRRAWGERLRISDSPSRYQPFIDRAKAVSDRAFGLGPARPRPVTALGAYRDHHPDRMADGDARTYFWSDGPPVPGSQVTLDLGRVRLVSQVDIEMGQADRPHDYLRSGVLERSVDGVRWAPVSRVDAPTVVAAVSDPTRYLRLRATKGQRHWLAVREFSVVPAPVDACADGDVDTVFPVTSGAVEVPIGPSRTVAGVVVFAARATPARGEIQVLDPAGAWHTVGRVQGEYTDVAAPGLLGTKVRVAFPAGPAVSVHEVLVR
ncbi:discoidin domain-containing protein [Actinokineospora sp. HUAS TT18]|uniref:discoidin domain-containing protein n=1 Tax=Actinokineospora sp. HUAS TT18 TaxID=3447451 RepID=UPI003F52435E